MSYAMLDLPVGTCINPFILNVFSYPYQLDESISNFRAVWWCFSFLFKCYKKGL